MMKPSFVEKPSFTVVGMPFTGYTSSDPYADGENNNEIGQVWDRFIGRIREIQHHVQGPTYGVCFGMPNDQKPWYVAAVEVEKAEGIPDGMMSLTVPAQRYAVFPCTLGSIGQTYRYIAEEWQAQSGQTHADGPDFEYYDDPNFDPNDPQHMNLSIYWPLK